MNGFGGKGPLKLIQCNFPAKGRDIFSKNKVAESPVEPDFECIQEWGILWATCANIPAPSLEKASLLYPT